MQRSRGAAEAVLSFLKANFGWVLSAVCGVALTFYAGLVFGHFGWEPAFLVSKPVAAVKDLRANARAYFMGTPQQHLRPLRFEETGVVVADAARAAPGVTFLVGLFGDTLGARLYANDGALLYEWPIDFFKAAPEEMTFEFDALIHGDALYPNGDIVVNLDGRGLFRVSACGDVIWRNHDRANHSIDIDDDGFIWTPILSPVYDEPRLLEQPFHFDRVAKFDPATGEKVLEIDLVQALIDAGMQGLALANQPNVGDVMHLNDVEVLSARMADQFPEFEAGDIMLSSRHFNQIWVLDGHSHALKWWIVGPTFGQHDPDFQPDGSITVLDNRPDEAMGGSRILRIRPTERTFDVVYESSAKNTFYTPYRGKHQFLANGDILIAETDAGRAFEVTPQGDVVWSFVNGWDEDNVGWIMGAHRYPPDYAAIASTTCAPD